MTSSDPFRKQPDDAPSGSYGTPPLPAGSSGAPVGWGGPSGGSGAPGGWGAPGGSPAGTPSRRNGLAVGALVLGVLALLTFWTVLGGILLGLAAVVLGILGLRRSRGGAGGGGLAGAGIGTGLLGVLLSIGLVAFGVSLFTGEAGQGLVACLESAGDDPDAQVECQQEFEDEFLEQQ